MAVVIAAVPLLCQFAVSASAAETTAHRLLAGPLQPARIASGFLPQLERVWLAHRHQRPRIVGGSDAAQGTWGFMAFVVYFDANRNPQFICSGTVVAANVVMTAGHCAVDENTGAQLDPSGYRVITGAVDWTDEADRQVSDVSQVRVNPSYNPSTGTDDAALLVLSSSVAAPSVRLASSVDAALELGGTSALIAGWGDTYGGQPDVQTTLQWAPTVVQNRDYCGQFNLAPPTIYSAAVELCATDYPYEDTTTCNGDSGGPLIAADGSGQPVEIGVTDFGPQDCNTDQPSYYATVRPMYAWAQSVIQAASPTPTPSPGSSPPSDSSGRTGGSYSGRTSQGRHVSFAISGNTVRNFTIVVGDRCPDGHTLLVHARYPTMTINGNRFGGRFAPVGGHRGETSSVAGNASGQPVTGTIKDTSYSSRERRLCHGTVQFNATHS